MLRVYVLIFFFLRHFFNVCCGSPPPFFFLFFKILMFCTYCFNKLNIITFLKKRIPLLGIVTINIIKPAILPHCLPVPLGSCGPILHFFVHPFVSKLSLPLSLTRLTDGYNSWAELLLRVPLDPTAASRVHPSPGLAANNLEENEPLFQKWCVWRRQGCYVGGQKVARNGGGRGRG